MTTDDRTRTGVLAALAGLDLMTASRLRAVLAAHQDPEEAWAVAAGHRRPGALVASLVGGSTGAAWRSSAQRRDPQEWARRCERLGVHAVALGDDRYPVPLLLDPEPPAVLFVRGDLAALEARRVGVVGTRNATGSGREFALSLGHDLAAADVAVVSGLAKGIDGAAHRGALRAGAAGPVAVVGNGLDRPYPRCHAELWASVADQGVLLSEWPPGTPPEPFRFPLRNRIIAGLSEVLVVVESRERGGSLITAVAAAERGIDVMAVPGSPHCRASAGTNQLLRDGAAPVTGAADVLVALGLDHRRCGPEPFDPRPMPRGVESEVLECVRARSRPLGDVVEALGIPLADAAMALARLERSGWVREADGWFEAVGVWGAVS